MNSGARASVRIPCAIVVWPGSSRFARSTSTWIHWSSPVASAKRLICSWVTCCQSLTPISVPTADLSSSKSLKTRIASSPVSELASSGGPDRHIGARRAFDRRKLPGSWPTSLDLPVAEFSDPLRPIAPPGAVPVGGALQPPVGLLLQRVVGPVAVLVRGRGIDHARDVTGCPEHEAHRSRHQRRRRERRLPRRDMVI